jgi:hypothetical protein
MLRKILLSAEREMMEKIRRQKLAELARIVGGEDWGFDRKVAPVLPVNRYRFGLSGGGDDSRVERKVKLEELGKMM